MSNTNKPHRDRFRTTFKTQFGYRLDDLFEKAFFSDELGFVKPNPQIYKQVEQQAKILPKETLFIDDNLKNVEAAIACGWHAYHIKVGKETILELFENS